MFKYFKKFSSVIFILLFVFFYSKGIVKSLTPYRIVVNHDFSNISSKADTLSIDFNVIKASSESEFLLWYWIYNLDDLKEKNDYYRVTTSGAQSLIKFFNGTHNTIFKQWNYRYKENESSEYKELSIENIYPGYSEEYVDAGLNGVQTYADYVWDTDTWYRMIVHIWKDTKTNNMFVGQWIQNISTGQWTLLSYFDTKLQNTYFELDPKQPLINQRLRASNETGEQEVYFKNLYIQDHDTKQWNSINNSEFEVKEDSSESYGKYEFGTTDDYFYMINGGTVENQEEYDQTQPKTGTYEISQPSSPSFGEINIDKFDLSNNTLTWKYSKTSTPQETVKLTIEDLESKDSQNIEINRPEVMKYEIEQNLPEKYKITFVSYDIFGNQDTKSITNVKEEKEIKDIVDSKEEKEDEKIENPNTFLYGKHFYLILIIVLSLLLYMIIKRKKIFK